MVKKKNIRFLGIDPSINVGKIANSKGLTTIVDFFNKRSVDKIIKTYGKPNIVVASEAVTIVTAVWIVKIVPRLIMKKNRR